MRQALAAGLIVLSSWVTSGTASTGEPDPAYEFNDVRSTYQDGEEFDGMFDPRWLRVRMVLDYSVPDKAAWVWLPFVIEATATPNVHPYVSRDVWRPAAEDWPGYPAFSAFILNGTERIPVQIGTEPGGFAGPSRSSIDFDAYGTRIESLGSGSCITPSITLYQHMNIGEWIVERKAQEVRIVFEVDPIDGPHQRFESIATDAPTADFTGTWSVNFESSEDPAVGVFEVDANNIATGTFLTTTGDYRYLEGRVDGDLLRLSCFDGSHAFLFHARMQADGSLTGDFWSGNWWRESWTATRDADAKLPDAFTLTKATQPEGLAAVRLPALEGDGAFSPIDPALIGPDAKVTLVELFGSWCPNCHDAAAYLTELRERYHDRGLRVVGVAFEKVDDLETRRERVRAYLAKHDGLDEQGNAAWPILLGGLTNKQSAAETIGVLDAVRSYPTTLFVDAQGRIVHVHQGFSGPAAGEAHTELRRAWESRIEAMLHAARDAADESAS